MSSLASHQWGDIPLLAESPGPMLCAWAKARGQEAEAFDKMAQPEEKSKLEEELAALKARKRLKARLSETLEYVSNLKRVESLKRAVRSLSTREITSTQNDLTDKVVTVSLRDQLEKELKALRCESVRVRMDARGVRGKTQVAIKLGAASKNVKLNEVLSEGEQRAVSLAFFLAEIGSAAHDGGIILDDPVSSLDHVRRARVAERLVEESRRRQVIVFTHDLVFLHELKSLADQSHVKYMVQTVRRAGSKVGIVEDGLPWLALPTSKRIGVLKKDLEPVAKLEEEGSPLYPGQAKLWTESLREAWERAVEEYLLNGVVQRFDRAVQTNRLKVMKAKFTSELAEEAMAGMTETSKLVHDQAAAINEPVPITDELRALLKNLEAFVKKFK